MRHSIMFARPLWSTHENRGATKIDIIRQLTILLCYLRGIIEQGVGGEKRQNLLQVCGWNTYWV